MLNKKWTGAGVRRGRSLALVPNSGQAYASHDVIAGGDKGCGDRRRYTALGVNFDGVMRPLPDPMTS